MDSYLVRSNFLYSLINIVTSIMVNKGEERKTLKFFDGKINGFVRDYIKLERTFQQKYGKIFFSRCLPLEILSFNNFESEVKTLLIQ